MSELGVALGVQPDDPNQVLRSINGQVLVFKKKSAPSEEQVRKWEEMKKRQHQILEDEFNYRYGLDELQDNRTIGNYRVVEHGEKLESEGLLTSKEIKVLDKLRAFYNEHPQLKNPDDPENKRSYGIVENGKIILSTPELRLAGGDPIERDYQERIKKVSARIQAQKAKH